VKILYSNITKYQVMSDLMKDFPPISREDHPVVIVEVVAQHLKIIKRKRKNIESYDEEVKEKPKKKQAKKAKAFKSVASDTQEEVDELEPTKVLEKRTRGSSEVVSPPTKKIQNQPKKPSRKLVLSKYTKEEDVVEDSSSLITRPKKG